MIDIHTHILPGMDDGAPDLAAALKMAALAVESGVTVLAATPHCMDFAECCNFWGPELSRQVSAFRAELKKANIPLTVVPGMEVFGTERVPALLRQQKLLGLNGSRYLLTEFPFHNCAAQATEILEDILALGIRPVVAHPERYTYVQEDPRLLNLWVEMGCLLQVNKGSLLGRFGRQVRGLAMELVARRFAFVVASDAHSPDIRTTWMRDVQLLLQEEFSVSAAEMLLEHNPMLLLKNEKIPAAAPHWFR